MLEKERVFDTVDTTTHQPLQCVLDHSVRDISFRYGGMELTQKGVELSEDACTVSTLLSGEHPSAVALSADREIFIRLAQKIMRNAEVSPEDVEDVAMEYFNIICGRIAAGLSQLTRTAPRFQVPRFSIGKSPLQDHTGPGKYILSYHDENHGSVQLICAGPLFQHKL